MNVTVHLEKNSLQLRFLAENESKYNMLNVFYEL